MSSSDYYWSRSYIRGFGKLWYLIIPQEANASGGGMSLLGSVVNEVDGGLFGRDYPEPIHLTTPQLILSAMDARRDADGIPETGDLFLEQKFSGVSISFDKDKVIKSGAGNFPGIPISLGIDYSKTVKFSITFGPNTRKLFIPRGYLTGLKKSVNGRDEILSSTVNIDKEFIIHEILLTDQYSVEFESSKTFSANFEASVAAANMMNSPGITVVIDSMTKRKVTVSVNDGNEYLIGLKNIDWDDF